MRRNDHLEWLKSKEHIRYHCRVCILKHNRYIINLHWQLCSVVGIEYIRNLSWGNIHRHIFYKFLNSQKPILRTIYLWSWSTSIRHNYHLRQLEQEHIRHFHRIHILLHNRYIFQFHRQIHNFKEVFGIYYGNQGSILLSIRYKQECSLFWMRYKFFH